MSEDPIVEEVHKIRLAHAEKFDFDLKEIFNDLKQHEEKSQRKIVKFKPKTTSSITTGK